jgi:predicted Zn-dependent protease
MAYTMDPRHPQMVLNDVRDIADGLLKVDAKSFQGLRIRGMHFMIERKVKESIESLRAANQVTPFTREVTLPLVRVLLADSQTEEAERLARAMIEKDKEFGAMYDLLYAQYMHSKNTAQAEALLSQKVANNPNQGVFLLQLAGHYFSQQRRPEMLKTLERITANPKDFPQGYAMTGEFFLRVREFEQAIQQFQQGERAFPKDKAMYRRPPKR